MDKLNSRLYVYSINLDTKGTFYADVCLVDDFKLGEDVFNIVPFEKSEGVFCFESYGMKNKNDVEGLEKFLKKIEVIESEAKVMDAIEFNKFKSLMGKAK